MFRGDGSVVEYGWLVSDERIFDHLPLIVRHFESKFVLIACFDSGRIVPTEEETLLGWREIEGGLLSPPVTGDLHLPADNFDEWWIFEDRAAAELLPRYDYFVNQTIWNLRSPTEMESHFDPSWERGSFQSLILLQERFWEMVSKYRPLAVISDGDRLVIASRDFAFLNTTAEHSDA